MACLKFLSYCFALNVTLSEIIPVLTCGIFLPGNIVPASIPPVASSASWFPRDACLKVAATADPVSASALIMPLAIEEVIPSPSFSQTFLFRHSAACFTVARAWSPLRALFSTYLLFRLDKNKTPIPKTKPITAPLCIESNKFSRHSKKKPPFLIIKTDATPNLTKNKVNVVIRKK